MNGLNEHETTLPQDLNWMRSKFIFQNKGGKVVHTLLGKDSFV